MRVMLIDSSHLFGVIYSASGQAESPNVLEFFKTCANSVKKSIREVQPDYVLVAIDDYQSSWRRDKNPCYCQSGFDMPIEFKDGILIYKELLREAGVFSVSRPGMEGKDIIGTICKKMEKLDDAKIYILSGNKRYIPILRDGITLRNNFSRNPSDVEKNMSSIMRNFGLTPEQMHAVHLLSGDKSIGFDGVKGIGEKTAIELVRPYENVHELIENAYKIDGKRGENVRGSLKLITDDFSDILMPKTELELGFSLSALLFKKQNKKEKMAA
jgi:DNA polymerase-1